MDPLTACSIFTDTIGEQHTRNSTILMIMHVILPLIACRIIANSFPLPM